MVVIAILFWLWFLVSVVILVRRGIRRRNARRIRRNATRAALHDAPATDDDDAPVSETEFADAPPVPEPAAVVAPVTPPVPTRAPAPAPVAAPSNAAGAAAPAAAIAPAPSSVATIARAAAAPVTVAQIIAGIEMPCGLVPLTLSDHDMRYDRGQRAHFFTTDTPALVVGTKLADELERIGLTVTPLSEHAALARRGQLAVEMRISTVGAAIDGVASSVFRSAPPNSVVVEFDVVPAS